MDIITKYSDYIIQSIEFFKTSIKTELDFRDISGLTDGQIEMINVSKQHPIVTMMANKLGETRSSDLQRSNILPAISVTPANPTDTGFTLGAGLQLFALDEEFIDGLKETYAKTDKLIQADGLITKKQIDLILGAYKKSGAGNVKCRINEWRKNEEINVSLWSETPDVDILLGNLLDSILVEIQNGFMGDNSKIKNMAIKTTKGLTNFNFGRVLFGTEYSLTFLNTYNNYTIYVETKIEDHDFIPTTQAPGEV